MNVFFDTSSLFKLYHKEKGTEELMQLFQQVGFETIYLSEITKIEFISVVWKKCRMGEISADTAIQLIEKFNFDSAKFTFVADNKSLAADLIGKHWKKGLRTLDSLQLASALEVKVYIKLFLTSDKVLAELSELEGLVTFQ